MRLPGTPGIDRGDDGHGALSEAVSSSNAVPTFRHAEFSLTLNAEHRNPRFVYSISDCQALMRELMTFVCERSISCNIDGNIPPSYNWVVYVGFAVIHLTNPEPPPTLR
jgi:hypothetical protein